MVLVSYGSVSTCEVEVMRSELELEGVSLQESQVAPAVQSSAPFLSVERIGVRECPKSILYLRKSSS